MFGCILFSVGCCKGGRGLGLWFAGLSDFFFATGSAAMGWFRRFDGFVGESLLQSPITRALAPDVTSVGACVLPHGHGHGLGALGLGVGWGLGLRVGCFLALALAWVFFTKGLLGACASRPLPSQTLVTLQHGCHLLPHAVFSALCDVAGCPLLGWAGFVCREGVAR